MAMPRSPQTPTTGTHDHVDSNKIRRGGAGHIRVEHLPESFGNLHCQVRGGNRNVGSQTNAGETEVTFRRRRDFKRRVEFVALGLDINAFS